MNLLKKGDKAPLFTLKTKCGEDLKDVASAYGVLYEDFIGFKGVAKRSAFVIDKNGVVQYAWSTDDPAVLPDFSAIEAALKA